MPIIFPKSPVASNGLAADTFLQCAGHPHSFEAQDPAELPEADPESGKAKEDRSAD